MKKEEASQPKGKEEERYRVFPFCSKCGAQLKAIPQKMAWIGSRCKKCKHQNTLTS